jgi:hypothetical protein
MGLMDDYVRQAERDLPRLRQEAAERHDKFVDKLIEAGDYRPEDHRPPGSPGDNAEIMPATPTQAELESRRRQALGVEEGLVGDLRSNAKRAAEIEGRLLERAEMVADRDLPNVLRAVADVQSKSVDGLLKLTGREQGDRQGQDFAQMLAGMAAKGYLRVNVNLDVDASQGGGVDEPD